MRGVSAGSRCAAVLVLMLGIPGAAVAEIPQVISYQGKVTDAGGAPVADGTYTMWFRIYDAVSGGNLVWDSGAQSVALTGGIFSVLLGESPMPALTLDFSQDYWLGVVFSGTSQTPRQRLASVGYAYMASGLVPGTLVSGPVISGTISALKVQNTATSGVTYGLFAESASPTGRAIVGEATATSGSCYGVEGGSYSTAGAGMSGWASATTGLTYGVQGWAGSSVGTGVYGWASRTSGSTTGVWGKVESPNGRAVFGEATATYGDCYGGRFQTASTYGYGVLGWASSTTGSTFGGRFETPSSSGRA
ncbi:MAG: hypothetical protein MUE60_08835, partial [Candidatus Eisenbacteria bacterium]|nr:hypothetical protein [Candidatus Eisenbacteria bacterium]